MKYIGNEYAQGVCIQLPRGEIAWVGNVYLPPVQNMQKRGMDEDIARSLIEDVTGTIPVNSKATICGDWNTRIGQLYPKIGESEFRRRSMDTKIT